MTPTVQPQPLSREVKNIGGDIMFQRQFFLQCLFTRTYCGCLLKLPVAVHHFSPSLFTISQCGCSPELIIAVHQNSLWLVTRTHRGCSPEFTVAVHQNSSWLFTRTRRGCSLELTWLFSIMDVVQSRHINEQ